jgi:hypothetical protein
VLSNEEKLVLVQVRRAILDLAGCLISVHGALSKISLSIPVAESVTLADEIEELSRRIKNSLDALDELGKFL